MDKFTIIGDVYAGSGDCDAGLRGGSCGGSVACGGISGLCKTCGKFGTKCGSGGGSGNSGSGSCNSGG